MADREKVIKDLEFCVNGHYKVELSLAKKILALLKEHDNCENCAIAIEDRQPIVRCKDCKFWYKDECSHLCKITGDLHPANWFCADGERR